MTNFDHFCFTGCAKFPERLKVLHAGGLFSRDCHKYPKISADVIWGKNMKSGREKQGKCKKKGRKGKEKGRKGIEKGRKGKEKEKRGTKRVK
jgi:hypothetical protein